MADRFEILIKGAALRNHAGALMEIGITDGRIAAIDKRIDGSSETTIDAQGNLVSESFVNTHLHLCKVYTRQMMDEEAVITSYSIHYTKLYDTRAQCVPASTADWPSRNWALQGTGRRKSEQRTTRSRNRSGTCRRRPGRITSYNVCYTKLLRGSGYRIEWIRQAFAGDGTT